MPYLNALSDFRDSVRRQARELKASDILKECDRLRDEVLPSVGVRLEDKVRAARSPRASRTKLPLAHGKLARLNSFLGERYAKWT